VREKLRIRLMLFIRIRIRFVLILLLFLIVCEIEPLLIRYFSFSLVSSPHLTSPHLSSPLISSHLVSSLSSLFQSSLLPPLPSLIPLLLLSFSLLLLSLCSTFYVVNSVLSVLYRFNVNIHRNSFFPLLRFYES
jgi:hypothetical protein